MFVRPPASRRPLSAAVMALVLAIGLVSVPLPTVQQAAAMEDGASVDAELLAELEENDEARFWVVLRAEANLDAATMPSGWARRGQAVVNGLTRAAERSQAPLRQLLDQRGVDFSPFWIVNAIHVTGERALVEELAQRPDVAEVRLERTFQLPEPAPEAEAAAEAEIAAVEWGIERIGAPQVWSTFGSFGEDIVVGSIDSGVQFDHPALVAQYRGNNGDGTFDHDYNWHDPSNVCGNPSLAPCDNNGHGTHTTGTIVGDDGQGNQIGVASGTKWIAAKGCETSNCSELALVSAGQWMLAPTDLDGENPDPDRRPHIVNNSWGNDDGTDTFYRSIVQAWLDAGMFPVFSNGNAGPACGTVGAPASYPESFGVGGFDINDAVYSGSSRGPQPGGLGGEVKPQVSAPGVNVRSALPGDSYGNGTGTSMAAPHVAGTIALMWSAAPGLQGDIEQTRQILTQTALDTDDTSCGGTPENNNVWGEGRLDAFAAVEASPRVATGVLTGAVTDAATDAPISGATVTILGAVERVRTTGADGTYSAALPVGDYSAGATAFGYEGATVDVGIAEGETTTADFALQHLGAITVSGTVTDGSGHGWPIYARVHAAGTPAVTFTNPLTGAYGLTLPAGTDYTITVEPMYDGYGGASEAIAAGADDITLNVELLVEECQPADGYEFGTSIGILGELNGALGGLLAGRGIPSNEVSWDDDLAAYDVIVINRPGDPGQAAFADFLDATDASGTGVVFLDTWSTFGNGVWLLTQHVGNPATRGTGFGSSNPYLYYDVLVEHPILDGFAVGEEIVLATTGFKDHAWFGGYEGDGRTVIADAARADTGVVGGGIGVQERATNRHALLSMHGASSFIGPAYWTDDGARLLVNALEWVAPDADFACGPVEGGLLVGHVTDANTGEGLNGATVTSDAAPDETATTRPTPDDPALGDGFYWLFSSPTGSQSFTASAEQYADHVQDVDVAAGAANEASFTLGAGLLTVEPGSIEASVRLSQSATRTFTITNGGTAPAEIELVESGASFELLGGGAAAAEHEPRQPSGSATPVETLPAGSPGANGNVLSADAGAEAGRSATPEIELTANEEVTLTHSASQTIMAGNSVACVNEATGHTTDNAYLRAFTLDDFDIAGDLEVSSVSFGVQGLSVAQAVTVNLYTLDGALAYDNMTLIGSAEQTLDPQQLALAIVPVSGVAPVGATLVVEIDVPDMVGLGSFFIGSNNHGQTAPSYLRSDACGLPEPTDLAELGFGGMHVVLNVTGEESGDVAWMELSQTAATIDPGEELDVTVRLDSAATEEEQPGTYGARVAIRHDTPSSVDPVGVTMEVTVPNNWGKVAGTVTGTGCDGDAGPLSGATVRLDGRRDQVTVLTDANGTYAAWLPANNNPVTLRVTHDDYEMVERTTRVIARKTVVEDFDLLPICPPVAEITPEALSFVLHGDESASDVLTIANAGGEELVWEITTAGGAAGASAAPPEAAPRSAPAAAGRAGPRVASTGSSVLEEGFEDGEIPPPGWTHQVANPDFSWVINDNNPHSGALYGSVFYDPDFVPQDEWLVTPPLELTAGTLSFWSFGSLIWCRDVDDNCDLNVWIVVGEPGGDDDVFVGRADDDWTGEFEWSQSSFDLADLLPGGDVRIGFQYQGMDGAQIALDSIELSVDGTVACASPSDVPWLAASPDSGATPPGESDPIEVTVDAAGLTPGEHSAWLCASTNDPGAPVVAVPVSVSVIDPEARPFITTWQTDNPGTSEPNQLSIPIQGGGYDFAVDWGDGTVTTWQDGDDPAGLTHTYAEPGTYSVEIFGDFPRIFFNFGGDRQKIVSVDQWGDIAWSSLERAFWGATNVQVNATDAPDLSGVTSMRGAFAAAYSLNADIGHWDTSNVTDMTNLFSSAFAFNGDIGGWDTSNVTSMREMFSGAVAFDADIGGWDVSAVTDMTGMFRGAVVFDGDIGGWDVSSVGLMDEMFSEAEAFNADIGGWDTSSVTSMSEMFFEASSFNADIGGWDVSNVSDMSYMFERASAFNQPIGAWDTSSATAMNYMFSGASSFNQPIGAWNVGNVTNMYSMFGRAGAFNQDIGGWDVGNVERMTFMFFEATSFNQDISGWDTSSVTQAASMFRGATSFNADVSGWDVSSMTGLDWMFAGATSFNRDIGAWSTANVTSTISTFFGATAFDQDISGWDVGSVTNTAFMFQDATSFDQDIGGWDVSAVTDMNGMFSGATAFDQDLGGWDVSNVGFMWGMLDSSGLSTANYDATLVGWAAQPVQADVGLGAAGLTYCAGADARQSLVDEHGWQIMGDSEGCP